MALIVSECPFSMNDALYGRSTNYEEIPKLDHVCSGPGYGPVPRRWRVGIKRLHVCGYLWYFMGMVRPEFQQELSEHILKCPAKY